MLVSCFSFELLAETFNPDQAARLFSVIAAGASLGAIVGPIISAVLSQLLDEHDVNLCGADSSPTPNCGQAINATYNCAWQPKPLSVNSKSAIGGNFMDCRICRNLPPGDRVIHNSLHRNQVLCLFRAKNLLSTYSRADRATIYGIRDALTNTSPLS